TGPVPAQPPGVRDTGRGRTSGGRQAPCPGVAAGGGRRARQRGDHVVHVGRTGPLGAAVGHRARVDRRRVATQPCRTGTLFRLAGYTAQADDAGESAISDRLRALLDQLAPLPAMVSDAQYFLLGYNQTYRYLVQDIESYAPEDRNNVLLTLADPAWRAAFTNIEDYSAALVARMRGVYGTTLTDPAWPPLLERLRGVPRFAQLWDSGAIGVE